MLMETGSRSGRRDGGRMGGEAVAELLQARRLFAAPLVVDGTDLSDTIMVWCTENDVVYKVNGGQDVSTPKANVTQIIVNAMDGDDTIAVNANVWFKVSVLGGPGNDVITGGSGNDGLHGEDGNDTIVGGAGNDIIGGGDGDDDCNGQAGDDRLVGGIGNDWLKGEDGADTMSGDDGSDTLRGSDGDDFLDGGAGSDSVYGQGGNDTLQLGTGADYGDGGDGDDIIESTADGVYDGVNGGAGFDTIMGFDRAGDYGVNDGLFNIEYGTD